MPIIDRSKRTDKPTYVGAASDWTLSRCTCLGRLDLFVIDSYTPPLECVGLLAVARPDQLAIRSVVGTPDVCPARAQPVAR
jgi:hypothetical protein